MSRRTKLSITALFLVLLAIPVVYLTITWHPENPLRFQLVEQAEGWESDPPSVGTYETVYIQITNTSAANIYVFAPLLINERTPPDESVFIVGAVELMRPLNPEPFLDADDELMIPPHGALYADCRVHPQHLPALRVTGQTSFTVSASWDTSSRLSLQRACHWLRRQLPESIHPIIPQMSLRSNRSPLEPYVIGAPAENRRASP